MRKWPGWRPLLGDLRMCLAQLDRLRQRNHLRETKWMEFSYSFHKSYTSLRMPFPTFLCNYDCWCSRRASVFKRGRGESPCLEKYSALHKRSSTIFTVISI